MSRIVSLLSFIVLVAFVAFTAGLWSAEQGNQASLLYKQIRAAWAARAQVEDSAIPPEQIGGHPPLEGVSASSRWIAGGPSAEIVVGGGVGQFLDLCPAPGCLAVAYRSDGSVAHAWPMAAEALATGPALVDNDFAYAGTDPAADQSVVSVSLYDNGDLLVSLLLRNSFPYGFGLARVRPDGSIVWRRRDYSHHWSTVLAGGHAMTPSYRIVEDELYNKADPRIRSNILCTSKQYVDEINEIDPDGKLVRSINLLALLLANDRYRFLLGRTVNSCDPLHLNYVAVATEAQAAGSDLVEPGDMLASMRSISAVALIAADGSSIKRVYTGTFAAQHAAQFMPDGDIVLFDNLGADPAHRASRIVRIDPDTGAEAVIFAPEDPADRALLSPTSGDIAISADGKRMLISHTTGGALLEIDTATGRILSRYDNLHQNASGEWHRFRLFRAIYRKPD